MKTSTKIAILALLVLVLFVDAAPCSTLVQYTTSDLGGGSWQYTYYVSGRLFLQNQTLAIFFDYKTMGNLVDTTPASADWTPVVFQPIPAGFLDGEIDETANFDNPSLAAPFTAVFDFSGIGTPGSQAFEVLDSNFSVLETGTTQASVPEPGTSLLLGGAIMVLAARKSRLHIR